MAERWIKLHLSLRNPLGPTDPPARSIYAPLISREGESPFSAGVAARQFALETTQKMSADFIY